MVKVALTANLQKYFPKQSIGLDAKNLLELLQKMDSIRENFSSYILEDNKEIRKHVNIFINGEVIRDKENLKILLQPGTQIHIMQALSGG